MTDHEIVIDPDWYEIIAACTCGEWEYMAHDEADAYEEFERHYARAVYLEAG